MGANMFRPFGGDQAAVVGVEDGRHDDSSCFADEVVIDFPSVAPAVDRMRRAFVAEERGEALRTAITLSLREAREGATIPLEVPVRCTCHTCGGRGETWTESCRLCRGSGVEFLRHQLKVLVPAGVLDGTRYCFTVTPRHHPPTRIELHVLVA
jgi:DnaJ-class molecular chaperone